LDAREKPKSKFAACAFFQPQPSHPPSPISQDSWVTLLMALSGIL
jgi:hypothetical protein